ncbi:chemotaxis protein CheW [Trichothermofontia sichuanensis B231]|uniref:chemotaxis protein CheW n=1 Tax=Trichothermofontia sichuanensis TaxID=3045816 RepID=UPI002247B1BC|nr:chemotaxis protein CheW [Trichothermofontia sichuanensis]UZQ52860.1 chemotaxis protein CheW [Trichothermofontia sichuanensis B231]
MDNRYLTSACHYLIFDLNQCRYGINTSAVQEIFFLPALVPVAEAPPDIVGVLNLRGEILPVMDLNRRFGRPSRPYQLTDSVIVLQTDNSRAGIIVDRVYDVEEVQRDRQAVDLTYGRGEPLNNQHFVIDLVEIGTQIVTLLDVVQILQYSDRLSQADTEATLLETALPATAAEATAEIVDATAEPSSAQSGPHDALHQRGDDVCVSAVSPIPGFAQVSPEVWEIFQQRARSLRSRTEQESKVGLQPLAVINLQGELFGIDLANIHEFTDIHTITPIPCCPSHIVGNINLRGEVVTLVDISHALNLPMNGAAKTKAMLIHLDELVAGVVVDDVLDVIYVDPHDVQPIPTALHTGHDEFLEGVAPYYNQSMGILDLPKIFLKGNLVINEEV